MSDKYFDSTPRKATASVNKNGVSVASDGSAFYDCSLVNSVTDSYLVPGTLPEVASNTEMTGSVPTIKPEAESPYKDADETL